MDLAFALEDSAFREEVRAFLAEKLLERLRYKVENGVEQQYDDMLEWHHILAKQGWVAPNWPAEHGGPGWSLTQKYIFDKEMGIAGVPRIVSFGINMCGPVLMAFGTLEQQQRHLPPMLAGEAIWCQGYSEPGAGSDLASLKTEAVRDGDHYVVNGSKI